MFFLVVVIWGFGLFVFVFESCSQSLLSTCPVAKDDIKLLILLHSLSK